MARREAGRGAVQGLGPRGAGRDGGPGAARRWSTCLRRCSRSRRASCVAYAVTSPQRLPMLPDVPTVAEAGLPGYDSTGWFGVVAPAGDAGADRRAAEARSRAALNDEQIKPAMRNLRRGARARRPGRGLRRLHPPARRQKWAKVIKTARASSSIDAATASMHRQTNSTTDVLIVGAGPVGLTLAMDLASRGVQRGRSPRPAATRRAAEREVQPRRGAHDGAVPPPGRGAEAARRRPAGRLPERRGVPHHASPASSCRASPSPAARDRYTETERPRRAGGRRPSRRTASTRSSWSRCCCAHAAALPGVTLLNRTQVDGFAQDERRRRRHGARPRRRRRAHHRARATWSAATAAARPCASRSARSSTARAVIQRVQSTYIRAPQLRGA